MKEIKETILNLNFGKTILTITAYNNSLPHFWIRDSGTSVSTKEMRQLASEILRACDKIEANKDFKNN